MIRLNSIKISGFKDPSIEKSLKFSTENISVIYGLNGSGKTTLLKILNAILSRDESVLLAENIKRIELTYQVENQIKELIIEKDIENKISWGKGEDLYESSSILFGIHRGVIQKSRSNLSPELLSAFYYLGQLKVELLNVPSKARIRPNAFHFVEEIDFLIRKINFNMKTKEMLFMIHDFLMQAKEQLHYLPPEIRRNFEKTLERIDYDLLPKSLEREEGGGLKRLLSQKNISEDFIEISDIHRAIINQYKNGQDIISERVKNAFYETIENAVQIEEEEKDFSLPDDFEKKLESKKSFVLQAIPKQKNSSLTDRLKSYLDTSNRDLTKNSKIFRAMLLNILEKAEEPNPTLESISKLIEIFNNHLADNKKLIVNSLNVFIEIGNGKKHGLSELSSGERNILSLLTLFLIIGRNKNFLMIDEPEISFNIKWQRDFLPLLSSLNTNSQIIVASHSPAIAHKNSKYLVELK